MNQKFTDAKTVYSTNQLIENHQKATEWSRTRVIAINRMKWVAEIVNHRLDITTFITDEREEATRVFFLENIANPENWKLPINPIKVKNAKTAELIAAILRYRVGGAEIEKYCENVYIVTSKGYYHYISA